MYKLYKISDELYQIHSRFYNEKSMEGTLAGIVTYCVTRLRFNVNELEDALVAMIHEGADSAEFDRNRKFTHSFNRKQRKAG